MQDIEKKTKQLKKTDERMKLMKQYRTETYMRFRGIKEADEIIRPKMVEILAEYLNQELEKVENKTDLVYRFEKKKLPKDIIVQFVTKNKKEDIQPQPALLKLTGYHLQSHDQAVQNRT